MLPLRIVCAVLVACGALARASASAVDDAFAVDAVERDYDLAPVDQFIEAARPRYGNNCCVKLIKDGRTLLRKSYGNWTLLKQVPIASTTKMISGAILMSLIDDGVLNLDNTAGQYLPNFTDKKAGITVRQMFSHTNGLPFFTPEDFDPPNYAPEHDKSLPSLQACVDIIATVPLDPRCDPPGSAFFYNGMGMQTAGRIVEILSGKSWDQNFQDRMAGPLGMTRSTYYAFGPTGNPNVAADMESNVDELGDFAWMLASKGVFNGRRILSERAVEAMFTNQIGSVPVIDSPSTGIEELFQLPVFRYGVGCWLEKVDPHTGLAWEINGAGGLGCSVFLDLKRNLAGVLMPRSRNEIELPSGQTYNDPIAVYMEMKQLLQSIIPEDMVLDVLQNDAAGLVVVAASPPAHGTAVHFEKHVTYTPEPGFRGIDTFTYTVEDHLGNRSTATVTVTVNERPKLLSEPTATPNPISLP